MEVIVVDVETSIRLTVMTGEYAAPLPQHLVALSQLIWSSRKLRNASEFYDLVLLLSINVRD